MLESKLNVFLRRRGSRLQQAKCLVRAKRQRKKEKQRGKRTILEKMAHDNCRCAEPRVSTWKQFCSIYGSHFSFMFLGLATLRIWLQCCQYDCFVYTDYGFLTVAGTLVRATVIAILVAICLAQGFSESVEQRLDQVSCIFMTIAAGLYFVQPAFSDVPLSLVASLVGSVGMAWIATTWIRVFMRLQPGEAFLYAILAMGLSAVVVFALGVLGTSVAYAMCIAMPYAAIASAHNATTLLDERPLNQRCDTRDALNDDLPRNAVLSKLLGVCLVNFSIGVARGYPSGLSIPLDLTCQAFHNATVMVLSACLVWWVLVKGHRFTLFLIGGIICAFASVGVALIAASPHAFGSAGAVLVTIANSLGVAGMWYCAYDFARHSSQHPYVVFGIAWICFLLPRELGRLLVLRLGFLLEAESVLLVAGALIMVVLILGMAFILSNRRTGGMCFMFRELQISASQANAQGNTWSDACGAPDGSSGMWDDICGTSGSSCDTLAARNKARELQGVSAQSAVVHAVQDSAVIDPQDDIAHDAQGRTFDAFSQFYGLTEREVEVARLMAMGRSRAVISEQLTLSQNTIKGHMHNIYTKAGVHSKQEFLDLIFAFDDAKSAK